MASSGPSRLVRGARRIVRQIPGARQAARRLRGRRSPSGLAQTGTVHAPVAPAGQPIVAEVRRVRWRAEGRLELAGWAYRVGQPDSDQPPVITAQLLGGDEVVRLLVRREHSEEANGSSRDRAVDHAGAGFVAILDPAPLIEGAGTGSFERRWQLTVALRDGEPGQPFSGHYRWGSAGMLLADDVGAGCLVRPQWRNGEGLLVIAARRAVTATAASGVDPNRLELAIEVIGGFAPRWLVCHTAGQEWRTELITESDRGYRAVVDLVPIAEVTPPAGSSVISWYLRVEDAGGRVRNVHWRGPGGRGRTMIVPGRPEIAVQNAPSGVLRIDVEPAKIVIDQAQITGADSASPVLQVNGRILSGQLSELVLQGARRMSPARRLDVTQERFIAEFPLTVPAPWSPRSTVLDAGGYRIVQPARRDGQAETAATVTVPLGEQLYRTVLTPVALFRIERDPQGRCYLHVGAPRPASETGLYHQSAIKKAVYLGAADAPLDGVYFESFSGRSANDNTLALHNELLRRRPDLQRFWAVSDLSVVVPPGVTKIVIHSRHWWEVLARARYVVTNCWLSGDFVRRDHQTVLQAWHGTPLKSLGLDRIGALERGGYAEKMTREVSMWNLLIAQNPYSAEIFRRAYRFGNEMLEIGYPRNDILSRPVDPGWLGALRRRLGVAEHEHLVLYLPTWREDTKTLYRELDFARLLSGLGPNHRLLVRGHSNTVRHDRSIELPGVIDVTMYPDVAELFLIADCLITDYSSAMFDFTITGKPVIFFTPDLDRYESTLRGTYFSLADRAPGPLLKTTDEVIEAVGHLDHLGRDYADAYRAWQRAFNAYEDGHAAERAIDHLLAHRASRISSSS